MDTTSLQPLFRQFLDSQSTDPLIQEQSAVQLRRTQRSQELLQPDRISALSKEDWQALVQDTNAWFGDRRNKQELWAKTFGENDERLIALRSTLAEVVRRAGIGLTSEDFNTGLETLPGFGPAYLSEFLALRYPDRYWLFNKQVSNFLEAQEVDLKADLPSGKKANAGEEYLAAGRHLADLRRALGEAAGKPVDCLMTDLFIYWVNCQEKPGDPTAARLAAWKADFSAERMRVRIESEQRAHTLLESKLGRLDESEARQFLKELSGDWTTSGKMVYARFMPALYGALANKMVANLETFNRWTERLWRCAENEIDLTLDQFWEKEEIAGAGTSLPTALLYLRDPGRYNIWLPILSSGLKAATDYQPMKGRKAEGYRQYNAAAQMFRERYRLQPQALDIALSLLARVEQTEPHLPEFPGFSEDTFAFLAELKSHNSDEWMHKDGDANEQRYGRVLREPLRSLFQAVAPRIKALDPAFETDVKFGKVMATIKKRFPEEEGPYHPYLWGAFYRQERSKQTDAQLFINVHPTHVNVGLSVAGAQGSDILGIFRRNLGQFPDMFLQLVGALPPEVQVATAVKHGMMEKNVVQIRSAADLQTLLAAELIDIQRQFTATEPILYQPDLADEVFGLFQALYPLFRFVTSEDPSESRHVADDSAIYEVEEEERYTRQKLYNDTFLESEFWDEVDALAHDKRQIILYGPPGTGKTWLARHWAQYWVEAAEDPGGKMEVVQFHPSYAYEEFVEGIRPESVAGADGRRELSYPVKKGLFRRFCDLARENDRRAYVLVLDEINRGELPRIFGELLYLLEYRQESVRLPYSGDQFAIPKNVYLVGTMNTADRSIALVDHALRRRFHFLPLKPDVDLLKDYLEQKGLANLIWVAGVLDLVNRRLSGDGVEWHLHVGHSHFMRPDLTEPQVHLIWKHSVLPTLEEYFYRQPERLKAYQLGVLKAELG